MELKQPFSEVMRWDLEDLDQATAMIEMKADYYDAQDGYSKRDKGT